MGKLKSKRFIKMIVRKYTLGGSVADLANRYKLPETTIYHWIDQYQEKKTQCGSYTLKQVADLINDNERNKRIIKLIHQSPFFQQLNRKEKMDYMKLLYLTDAEKNVHLLSDAFLVDRGTFLNFLRRSKGEEAWFNVRRRRLEKEIMDIYNESIHTYGAKKIYIILKKRYGERVSLGYVHWIMRDLGIKGAVAKSTKRINARERRELKRKQNLQNQDFSATAPNQKWVSDCKVVYFKAERRVLCVVVDLFSRKVIGYHFGKMESTRLITTTIKQAIATRHPKPGLIIHTDRGTAYSSYSVNRLLRKQRLIHSYSLRENPPDNGVAEGFFSRLSAEELSDAYSNRPYRSERDMMNRINSYVERFNSKRIHEYNDYRTPDEVEEEYYRAK